MTNDDYLAANRKLWNVRTPLHFKSKFYDVQAFKAGHSTLCGIETDELGEVRNKSVLHLQCHFGLDSLSLAQLGARVTGVDFSETAITTARQLAAETQTPAEFLCHDVLSLPDHLDEQFDVVFTSFGVLGWLPDITRWGQVVGHFLKPGGCVYLLEFHPSFIQLDDQGDIAYDYFFANRPDEDIATTTYADRVEHQPLKEYWWNHSISDTVTALLDAGLKITLFNEFSYSAYQLNSAMIEEASGQWVHEKLRGKIPYMFSLKADK